VPEGPGWFVLNAKDAPWYVSEAFGVSCMFESRGVAEHHFPHLGVNIHVVQPGQPACKYHRESSQEAFLVLSGECRLLVDGQERLLKAWDFVNCAPGTDHVFVGAGTGPCAILMIGARIPGETITYPVSELADRYGAGVPQETHEPKVAYAGIARPQLAPAPAWLPLR
jgi:uncharacterized cupin superfamily protein